MAFSFLSSTGHIVLPWSPVDVYQSLIDYDSWLEWLPSITSSRLLTKEDTLAIVQLGFSVRAEEDLILECIQTTNSTVLTRVIEGRVPLQQIQWEIQPAESGASRVTLSVERRIPRHLSGFAYWRVLNPAACLEALRSWMAAVQPGPEISPGSENLFELWETDTGLVCWIRGKKYSLTPVDDNAPVAIKLPGRDKSRA
jgi:ribosome-associated toxin RatA of RatAB toxin-antitoxin module